MSHPIWEMNIKFEFNMPWGEITSLFGVPRSVSVCECYRELWKIGRFQLSSFLLPLIFITGEDDDSLEGWYFILFSADGYRAMRGGNGWNWLKLWRSQLRIPSQTHLYLSMSALNANANASDHITIEWAGQSYSSPLLISHPDTGNIWYLKSQLIWQKKNFSSVCENFLTWNGSGGSWKFPYKLKCDSYNVTNFDAFFDEFSRWLPETFIIKTFGKLAE